MQCHGVREILQRMLLDDGLNNVGIRKGLVNCCHMQKEKLGSIQVLF